MSTLDSQLPLILLVSGLKVLNTPTNLLGAFLIC